MSILRIVSVLFLLMIVGVWAKPALAQQKESENSLLPEIDPQDIEIRSQFKARFPGIRRQPILGFDPNPSVYQIDPNRKPFMETQEQVVANLPVSDLSRPAPPDYKPLFYSEDIKAFGRAGIGSYISPEAQFWGVHRFDKKSYLGGDFSYSSSDGHLEDQPSSFRFFNANADFASKLNRNSQIHLTAGAQSDFNHLFVLSPSVSSNNPRKDYTGFNLGGDFQQFKNSIEGWTGNVNFRYFDVNMDAASLSAKARESIYAASLADQWAGSHVNETFGAQAGIKGGVYDLSQNQDHWMTAQGGAEYQRLFNYSTQLDAKARVYYTTDVVEDKVYFGPFLKIDHFFGNSLKLTAEVEGKPYLKTTEQHHQTNRFLNTNNPLRHTYSIDASAEASLEYYHGSTIHGGVSYMNAQNYPYYFRQSAFAGSSGARYYNVGYMDATNLKIYAGITHQLLPERFWVDGEIYAQNPKLDNGSRIPYKENWGINSSLNVRPFNQLTIQGWANYTGPRKTLTTGDKLGGYLMIGGQVDVQITKNFGAYAKMVNLLSQDYQVWQGYTERPMQVYGGLTVKLK